MEEDSLYGILPHLPQTEAELAEREKWAKELISKLPPLPDMPVRQKSARGIPQPNTSIERRCKTCGASFIGLAFGKTGERGIWRDWSWYCSVECDPEAGKS